MSIASRASPPTSASASTNARRSAECAARSSISSALTRIGLPGRAVRELERQLLELAQQPLLALPHLRDQRLRGRLVERQAEPGRLLARPLGQLPRLDGTLLDDLARRPP